MAGDEVEGGKQGWKKTDRKEEGIYLKGHIGHGLGQVVCFEAVPVIEMLPHEDRHL